MEERIGVKNMSKYVKIDNQIVKNPETERYYVVIGCGKMSVFPKLDDAVKFRDEMNEFRLSQKIKKMKVRMLKEDEEELKSLIPYPYNALAIVGLDSASISPKFVDSFDETLSSVCSEREALYIRKKFKDEMTLEEVGKEYGVTKERVRQICKYGLMKVKSKLETAKKNEEFEQTKRLVDDLIAKRAELVEEFKHTGVYTKGMERAFGSIMIPEPCPNPTNILDLDLSLRSYNCLRRSGIETVEQLACMSRDDILGIKNMGKKCCREVVDKLREFGITVS